MKVSGAPLTPYGAPATFEREVTRMLIRSQPGTTGAGGSRSPLEALEGIITPSGLHFERHHNGVPAIDPAQHQLLVHGVATPLTLTCGQTHGFVSCREWTGVPLRHLLAEAGVDSRAD
jgi:sulfane dehydrogenase subunit SoxC